MKLKLIKNILLGRPVIANCDFVGPIALSPESRGVIIFNNKVAGDGFIPDFEDYA